jgi:hypothetical protein
MDGWIVLYYCLELGDFTNYSQIVISPRLMRIVKFTLHAEVSNVNPNTNLPVRTSHMHSAGGSLKRMGQFT